MNTNTINHEDTEEYTQRDTKGFVICDILICDLNTGFINYGDHKEFDLWFEYKIVSSEWSVVSAAPNLSRKT